VVADRARSYEAEPTSLFEGTGQRLRCVFVEPDPAMGLTASKPPWRASPRHVCPKLLVSARAKIGRYEPTLCSCELPPISVSSVGPSSTMGVRTTRR
jgi:hypothetical protein